MQKIILSIAFLVLFTACHSGPEPPKKVTPMVEVKNDTLPDASRFVFTIDDKSYSLAEAGVTVHYSESDSTLTIDAGHKDGDRLSITITDVKHTPGYRGNAWQSVNTKLAGSEALIFQPTVIFYKNEGTPASWNNFNDGYHTGEPKNDNSLYIYGLRQTGERNFIIKGRISTRVLKNVYESGSKEFNKDHDITGEFVIRFEDYWLKL